MYRNILLIFIVVLGTLSGETPSSSDMNSYRQLCKRAIEDEMIFQGFKRHEHYTTILEHVSFYQGEQYLHVLHRQSPELIPYLMECKKNDLLGDPVKYYYESIGECSPTTLRYIKVASDLKKTFYSLKGKDIVEIGGGYGGQCLILSILFKPKSYTIVDLEEPLNLAKKYLNLHGVDNVIYLTPQEIDQCDKRYDLVISNYAFSECNKEWQREYARQILQRADKGYLTCNSGCFLQGFTTEEIKHLLDSLGLAVQKSIEIPQTSVGGCIFSWDKKAKPL